jgi:hypothetical protein
MTPICRALPRSRNHAAAAGPLCPLSLSLPLLLSLLLSLLPLPPPLPLVGTLRMTPIWHR